MVVFFDGGDPPAGGSAISKKLSDYMQLGFWAGVESAKVLLVNFHGVGNLLDPCVPLLQPATARKQFRLASRDQLR